MKKLLTALLSFFFHHLYHSLAFSYDLVAAVVSLGRWKSWVRAAIPLLQGTRVLELGFGPGHLQTELLRAGWQVFGLDESRQMAGMAARRLRGQKLAHCLARGSALQLPFRGGVFDSVVATFPSPYIQQPETLSEIQRVLRPGGRLVVLLSATLRGRTLPEQASRLLFQVTGEAPDLNPDGIPLLQPYLEAGFDAQVQWMNLSNSQILVILATS